MRFEVWGTERLELGEGLRWTGARLVMVDILAGRLLELDRGRPGPPKPLHRLDVPLGSVAPVEGRPGAWLAAAGTGVALLDEGGRLDWLDRPEDGAATAMRVNDGACDPAGRFWFGTMSYDGTEGAGAVYRVAGDGTVRRMLDGITVPNGPAFSPDGTTMYLADSARGTIHAYTLDGRGDLGERRTFATVPAGDPDGMQVDDEGHVWAAVWGAGEVRRFAPDGALAEVLMVPAVQPTSVCLAGGLLFVSSATSGLAEPGEDDGRVFAAAVEVTAPPAAPARL